jgi:hypothetical protein
LAVKRLVIDVLIPHEPDIIEFSESLAGVRGVDGVTVHVLEIDEKTKTVEITVEGNDLTYVDIQGMVERYGGSIHSIDMVSAGKKLIDSQVTRREEE